MLQRVINGIIALVSLLETRNGRAAVVPSGKDWRLIEQLQIVQQARAGNDNTLWLAFSAFWGFSGLLLVALFDAGKLPTALLPRIAIALSGGLSSLAWYLILRRSIVCLKHLEGLTKAIQHDLQMDSRYQINVPKGGPSARAIMSFCALAAMILWTLALILFLVFHHQL
jgi:hypothetical protein